MYCGFPTFLHLYFGSNMSAHKSLCEMAWIVFGISLIYGLFNSYHDALPGLAIAATFFAAACYYKR